VGRERLADVASLGALPTNRPIATPKKDLGRKTSVANDGLPAGERADFEW
jgi:hypothetical protein